MAFNKIEYKTGDVLTADQMNKLQDCAVNNESNIVAHVGNKENPHKVTAKQVGADAAGSATKALSDAKEYTDAKIAAIPTPDVSGQINTHNTNTYAHNDIRTSVNNVQSIANTAKNNAATAQSTADNHIANKNNPHGVTAAQVGAVPTSRTVNGKPLSSNITLGASDVGAAASNHTHDYAASNHTHSNYVPTSRTVNGKPLSGNITLSASDVGAAASNHTHSYANEVFVATCKSTSHADILAAYNAGKCVILTGISGTKLSWSLSGHLHLVGADSKSCIFTGITVNATSTAMGTYACIYQATVTSSNEWTVISYAIEGVKELM